MRAPRRAVLPRAASAPCSVAEACASGGAVPRLVVRGAVLAGPWALGGLSLGGRGPAAAGFSGGPECIILAFAEWAGSCCSEQCRCGACSRRGGWLGRVCAMSWRRAPCRKIKVKSESEKRGRKETRAKNRTPQNQTLRQEADDTVLDIESAQRGRPQWCAQRETRTVSPSGRPSQTPQPWRDRDPASGAREPIVIYIYMFICALSSCGASHTHILTIQK